MLKKLLPFHARVLFTSSRIVTPKHVKTPIVCNLQTRAYPTAMPPTTQLSNTTKSTLTALRNLYPKELADTDRERTY